MIGISMTTADSNGALIIREDRVKTEIRQGPGRVTRTANLDGTVTINHGGVVDGDRTFRVFSDNLNKTDSDTMYYIHENSTLVNVSANDGAYVGAIDFLSVNNGILDLSILIKQKDSA